MKENKPRLQYSPPSHAISRAARILREPDFFRRVHAYAVWVWKKKKDQHSSWPGPRSFVYLGDEVTWGVQNNTPRVALHRIQYDLHFLTQINKYYIYMYDMSMT